MAERFNNYFSGVGADKTKNSNKNTFKTYMSKRRSSSLFLKPTNPAEVFNIFSYMTTFFIFLKTCNKSSCISTRTLIQLLI